MQANNNFKSFSAPVRLCAEMVKISQYWEYDDDSNLILHDCKNLKLV
jgi:hypothetical protein